MTRCFAYIRVSTPRQGEKGVSLPEQRSAIEQFAFRHGIEIVAWFEERESAARVGRPAFTRMLSLLRRGQAQGLIIHKIDRSARNLKDWADLGELIDRGFAVHFANESLDLGSRGGRLSADIQAVVASDYIRNLREETKKGIYGRLKQGLYPFPAPPGYLNSGKGKRKEVDPIRGPLIRKAFELYATNTYTLPSLAQELARRGLATRAGKPLCKDKMSTLLHNPFYYGLISIERTGESFEGVHEPLVSKKLFDQVQAVLRGKTKKLAPKHDYLFRGLLTCKSCLRRLVGERQKGHIYYRCHGKRCSSTCLRQELADRAVKDFLSLLMLSPEERRYLARAFESLARSAKENVHRVRDAIGLALGQVNEKLGRLTDLLLEGTLDRDIYNERKRALLEQRAELQDRQREGAADPDLILKFCEMVLELASTALLSHRFATDSEKRELLVSVSSNRWVSEKSVVVEPRTPFSLIANRNQLADLCPQPATTRSVGDVPNGHKAHSHDELERRCEQLAEAIWEWVEEHPEEIRILIGEDR